MHQKSWKSAVREKEGMGIKLHIPRTCVEVYISRPFYFIYQIIAKQGNIEETIYEGKSCESFTQNKRQHYLV